MKFNNKHITNKQTTNHNSLLPISKGDLYAIPSYKSTVADMCDELQKCIAHADVTHFTSGHKFLSEQEKLFTIYNSQLTISQPKADAPLAQKRRNTMEHPEVLPGGRNANQFINSRKINNKISKRSKVMNYSTFSKIAGRSVIALLTIALIATMAFGQNVIVTSTSGTSITGGGIIKVKGNIDTHSAGAAVTFPGTVQLTGTSTQDVGVSDTRTVTFTNIEKTAASTATMSADVTVNSAFTLDASSGTFAVADKTLILKGDPSNSGGTFDVSNTSGKVYYSKASGGSGQSTLVGDYKGSLILDGTATHDLVGIVSAATFSHTGGALTVNHNLTVSDAAPSFATIADVTGNSTLTLSGGGAKSIAAITTITSGSAISNTGTTGLLTVTALNGNAGTINGGAGGVTFSNAASNGGAINGGAGAVTFSSTLAHTAGTITAGAGGVTFTGIPTISSGAIVTASTGSLTFNADVANSGTISVTSTGTATFKGDFSATGTLTFDPTSTEVFSGSATTQNIPAKTYGKLTIGGSNTEKAAGDLVVAGGGAASLALNNNLDMNGHTLQITDPTAVVSGSFEVDGAVERNHTYSASTDYAFNRAEVKMNFASSIGSTTPITITMTPTTAPSNVTGTSYVNRKYAVSSAVALASNNATIQLYYLNSELGTTATASKLGFYKNVSGTLSKLTSNSGAYTRNAVGGLAATVALSLVNEGLGSISEIALQNIGYATIANGPWASTSTWGTTSDDKPGATDDATISASNTVSIGATATIANLTIASSGVLNVNNGTAVTFNATTINNSGSISVTSGNTLALTSTLTNNASGSVDITGIATLKAVTNKNTFTVETGGAVTTTGAFDNQSTATLTTVGTGALTVNGDLTVAGSIVNAGTITVQ